MTGQHSFPGIHPFDLQARAALAAHGLTGLLDPQRKGLQYFVADWQARPPRADHTLWDFGDGSGRHLDALGLVRTMVHAGAPEGEPAAEDLQVEEWVHRQLGPDGLSWLPSEPWARPWGADVLLVDPQPDDVSSEVSWSQRGTLMGLLTRFLRTSDERYLAAARGIVTGLTRIVERHPDGWFLPEGYYRRGGWRYRGPDLHPCIAEYNAAVVPALVRLAGVADVPDALELAERLASFALTHTEGYGPGGELVVPDGDLGSHFHTRSNFVLGVLMLGLAQRRPDRVEWARSSYEQLRRWGTEFGWFPEGIGLRHGELCCTTDMIEIALLLGREVSPRYFADAERFGRNHLLQSQWSSLERLRAAVAALPAPSTAHEVDPAVSTTDDVVARQVGAFASRAAMGDGFHLDSTAMMQCCNAAGARGIYDLWRYAVREGTGSTSTRLDIDLRFSVRTDAIQVVSYEPARGRLEVTPFRDCEVGVRLPTGVRNAVVHAAAVPLNHPPTMEARDGYVVFPAARDVCVLVEYDLPERTADYTVGAPGLEDQLTGHWQGETLVGVEPAGRFHPFYELTKDLTPVTPSLPAHGPIDSL